MATQQLDPSKTVNVSAPGGKQGTLDTSFAAMVGRLTPPIINDTLPSALTAAIPGAEFTTGKVQPLHASAKRTLEQLTGEMVKVMSMAGANKNGVDDDRPAFLDAISAASTNNMPYVFMEPGNGWRFNATASITAPGVTIYAPKAKLLHAAATSCVAIRADDVTLHGLELDGNFDLHGTADHPVVDVRPAGTGLALQNFLMKQCKISNHGKYAVKLAGTYNGVLGATVEDCEFREGMIYQSNLIQNLIVRRNKFWNTRAGMNCFAGSLHSGFDARKFLFEGNDLYACARMGFEAPDLKDVRTRLNRFHNIDSMCCSFPRVNDFMSVCDDIYRCGSYGFELGDGPSQRVIGLYATGLYGLYPAIIFNNDSSLNLGIDQWARDCVVENILPGQYAVLFFRGVNATARRMGVRGIICKNAAVVKFDTISPRNSFVENCGVEITENGHATPYVARGVRGHVHRCTGEIAAGLTGPSRMIDLPASNNMTLSKLNLDGGGVATFGISASGTGPVGVILEDIVSSGCVTRDIDLTGGSAMTLERAMRNDLAIGSLYRSGEFSKWKEGDQWVWYTTTGTRRNSTTKPTNANRDTL